MTIVLMPRTRRAGWRRRPSRDGFVRSVSQACNRVCRVHPGEFHFAAIIGSNGRRERDRERTKARQETNTTLIAGKKNNAQHIFHGIER